MLDIVSYYWKLDSLGSNGFRLYAYPELIKCKMNTVSEMQLIDKLGLPNEKRNTNVGVEYRYYFYDEKSIPPKKSQAFECGYISFFVDNSAKKVIEIVEGTIDY